MVRDRNDLVKIAPTRRDLFKRRRQESAEYRLVVTKFIHDGRRPHDDLIAKQHGESDDTHDGGSGVQYSDPSLDLEFSFIRGAEPNKANPNSAFCILRFQLHTISEHGER